MAAAATSSPVPSGVPARRLRRLRRTPALRRLVAETSLGVDDLVAPLFVREGTDGPTPIESMPGEVQHSVDSLVVEAKRLVSLGLPALILFGVPARKDDMGSGAWDPNGVVQVALRAVRDAVGDELVLMADLCLDEYTDHGHCGVLGPSGEVLNDPTLELYERIALAQAEAGADIVAPSGMMDGQVAAIRAALDGAGRDQVGILAYAANGTSTALLAAPSTSSEVMAGLTMIMSAPSARSSSISASASRWLCVSCWYARRSPPPAMDTSTASRNGP